MSEAYGTIRSEMKARWRVWVGALAAFLAASFANLLLLCRRRLQGVIAIHLCKCT